MNEFQLARLIEANEAETVYSEIFQMVKDDPEWLNDIVHNYVMHMTDEVMNVKHIVNAYNNLNNAPESSENDEKK